jgi:hypothetical protein
VKIHLWSIGENDLCWFTDSLIASGNGDAGTRPLPLFATWCYTWQQPWATDIAVNVTTSSDGAGSIMTPDAIYLLLRSSKRQNFKASCVYNVRRC